MKGAPDGVSFRYNVSKKIYVKSHENSVVKIYFMIILWGFYTIPFCLYCYGLF